MIFIYLWYNHHPVNKITLYLYFKPKFINLFIFFFVVLITIAKADYIWNGTVTLGGGATPNGTGDATASAGSVGITFSDLDDSELEFLISINYNIF